MRNVYYRKSVVNVFWPSRSLRHERLIFGTMPLEQLSSAHKLEEHCSSAWVDGVVTTMRGHVHMLEVGKSEHNRRNVLLQWHLVVDLLLLGFDTALRDAIAVVLPESCRSTAGTGRVVAGGGAFFA